MDKIDKLYKEVVSALDEIDVQEYYENGRLEKAMEYFCSNYDKGYGMKCAIGETLTDQYNNHREDLTEEELKRLLDIIDGAI